MPYKFCPQKKRRKLSSKIPRLIKVCLTASFLFVPSVLLLLFSYHSTKDAALANTLNSKPSSEVRDEVLEWNLGTDHLDELLSERRSGDDTAVHVFRRSSGSATLDLSGSGISPTEVSSGPSVSTTVPTVSPTEETTSSIVINEITVSTADATMATETEEGSASSTAVAVTTCTRDDDTTVVSTSTIQATTFSGTEATETTKLVSDTSSLPVRTTVQPSSPLPTTSAPGTTIASTCGFLISPLYLLFLIPAIIGGMLLGALLMYLICFVYRKKKGEKYDVNDEAKVMSVASLREMPSGSGILEKVSAKEDLLKDAMGSGSIPVLDFAITQAISTGMFTAAEPLVKKAEAKLQEWRRAQSQLQNAYNAKDLTVLEDYMHRFEALDIKDEAGLLARASDLLNERNSLKTEMRMAANQKSEMDLATSIDRFEKLGLPQEYVSNDADYLTAQRTLESLRKERLLQGRSHDEVRMELQAAVASRDKKAIRDLAKKFDDAQIPDTAGDLEKAKKALEEIEIDEHSKQVASWQKLMDASATRNYSDLREAISRAVKDGVEQADIREAQKLLISVEREDQMLHQIREQMVVKDLSKLVEAIAVFRTPGLQLVDKTGDIKRAEDLVERIRGEERMERAKGDAMWRLHTARSVGDIDAMDGMIKALEGLASAGMLVDEAMLLRAKTELETMRGKVDYRTRMESIKSAVGRAIKSENVVQLEDLIDQMVGLSTDGKFAMTADDSRLLDESRDLLHDLKRKHALKQEIDITRPALQVPLLPGMVDKLAKGVETMQRLKEAAAEFPGVFTPDDEELLKTASLNSIDLKRKTEKMKEAEMALTAAMNSRDYADLTRAIALAEEAPFIEESTLEAARDLAAFLDPPTRIATMKTAIASRNIPEIEKALEDFKSARVPGQSSLEAKAVRTLAKLKRLEKKRKRAEQKRKREAARRDAEIALLNDKLRAAMDSKDIYILQDALDVCEDSGYRDEEIPLYFAAEELFEKMTIENVRSRLKDGIERRDIQQLETAIDDADYGGYVPDLVPEYSCAKDLLYDLRELHDLREKVVGMDRSVISELQRYRTPPPVVLQVMTGVLTLLGEKQQKAAEWWNIQSILSRTGKDSLARRVRRNAPGDVSLELCEQIDSIIGDLTLAEVNAVSVVTGTFLAWITCTTREARALHHLRQNREREGSSSSTSSVI